ncbi:hypothetical protein JAO29_12000 [Edaphobacter sp. HDX4]|uniref:hypothetical protein n=1 Tax=Edaphobacter sp. HDX4 TaxID=2794064 RepID=UPI002FE55DBB
MRSTICLAGLLALATTMVSCHQPTAPQQEPTDKPTSAPVQTDTPAHQPDTTAIDQSVSTNIGDPAKLREVMATLQQATRKHDAPAVAALVSYPITIDPHTPHAVTIRTPQAFIARYDQIVTPQIGQVIENQKYESLFVNDQGAMLGDGEVWISGICKDNSCKQVDIRIRTIQNTAGKPK